MLGRMVFATGALFLLLALAAPAADADQNVLKDQQYQMSDKNIIVHIAAINVVDIPQSNIMPQPNMKYYQIIYKFENTGDTTDKGFIQPIFIDSNNGQYRYLDYTSKTVPPHATTDNDFIEMPVPKNIEITKIVFIEGFKDHTFVLPQPTDTSQASSLTPTPHATPAEQDGYKWGDCLPLIPFAMAGGIAGMGIVINRCGIRKR